MSSLADLYEQLRNDISGLASELEPEMLTRPVPATPGWSIIDVVAHLAADATCLIQSDFPVEFFGAMGDGSAVTTLNMWTRGQLEDRKGRSLEKLLDEWRTSGDDLLSMMRGEKPWPDGSFMFIDRVLVTDAAVHQQDIFGALEIVRDREGVQIKIGLRSYIVAMGWRLTSAGLAPLRFDVGEKSYTTSDGEPAATVRGTRFELFRAMSGRRSREQIAAYDWDGDPEPYIPYFYPYGIRQEALVE